MEFKREAEVKIQRSYYAKTAQEYDGMHLHENDEHFFALGFMLSVIDSLEIRSILDIGSGTGRAVAQIKAARPDVMIKGVEPVEELREVAYAKGISREEIVPGDALALEYKDGEFDMVCEFGILHHIKTPERGVGEMLRVAKKAIFISDSNNFGQGSWLVRSVKQGLNAFHLWPLVNFVKTRGRGYSVSEEDGLGYSYSVFNNYDQIRRKCIGIHVVNTVPAGINPYRTAASVALLGIKK